MIKQKDAEAGPTVAGIPYEASEIRIAVRCSVCGHWMTDLQSIGLGVGPKCRGDRG